MKSPSSPSRASDVSRLHTASTALLVLVAAALIFGVFSASPASAAHTTRIVAGPAGVPATVDPGGKVQCTVQAVDSETRDMKYKWEATGGTFNDATANNPMWTAPANATAEAVTFTIKVSVTTAPKGLESILGAPVATGEFQQTVNPGVAAAAPVDLQVQPDWIVLSLDQANDFMLMEPAADRQCVACAVVNASENDAENVHVRFMAGPAGGNAEAIGEPVAVGAVAAGASATAVVMWNMQGQNIANYQITAEVYIPDLQDATPANNTASITASIAYVNNGRRAFSWPEDSFAFGPTSIGDQELADTSLAAVTAVVGQMGIGDTSVEAMVNEMLLPVTFLKLAEYFDAAATESAGHSRGMAAAAAIYYVDGSVKPVAKPTWKISEPEAAASIAATQDAQMVGLMEAVLKGENYLDAELTPQKALADVTTYLRDRRECALLEIYGRGWGHCVLAYKMIAVEGRDPVVYIYDPAFPPSPQVADTHVMPQLTIGEDSFSAGEDSVYDANGAEWIGVQDIERTFAVADSKTLVGPLKRIIYEMAGAMARSGKTLVSIACPADAFLLDARGRRVGVVNDQLVTEVPRADVLRSSDVEIYLLPGEEQFTLQVRGTGPGSTRVNVMRGDSTTRMSITAFTGIPTAWGTAMTGVVKGDGAVDNLMVDGVAMAPTIKGFLGAANTDVWGIDRNRPPTRPVVSINPPTPGAADGLYCRAAGSIDPDGDPIEYTFQWYRNGEIAEGRTFAGLGAKWTRDGQTWRCVVTPNDGQLDGPTGEATVTIAGAGTATPVVEPTDETADWQYVLNQAGGYSMRIPLDWAEEDIPATETSLQRFRKNLTRNVAVHVLYERTGPMNQAQLKVHADNNVDSPVLQTKVSERQLTVEGGVGLEMVFTGTEGNVPFKTVIHHLCFGDDYYSVIGLTDQGTEAVNLPVVTKILDTFTRVAPATVVPEAAHDFALTSPAAGAAVGNTVNVSGTAAPGSKVRVTVNYWFRVIVSQWAQLSQTEVTADAAGQWKAADLSTDISVFGKSRRYEIVAELLGADGEAIATEKIEVKRD